LRIVILGAGSIGGSVANELSSEENDIIVIDNIEQNLEKVNGKEGIITIHGNASSPKTLSKAGLDNQTLLLCLTDVEETNILASIVARSQFEIGRIVCRLTGSTYTKISNEIAGGVDYFINPEDLITNEIKDLLVHPGALEVLDFDENRTKLVSVYAKKTGLLVGRQIKELKNDLPDYETRIPAIYREDQFLIPNGDTVINEEDEVYFIADENHIEDVTRELQKLEDKYTNIYIAGCGNLGKLLAKKTNDDFNVKVIEKDAAQCEKSSEDLDGVLILNADVADKDFLASENIENCDVFIAVTQDDETNVLCSMMAKKLGAKKTITIVNKEAYLDLVEGNDLDIIIFPVQITVSHILKYIRKGSVFNAHKVKKGAAEVMELNVDSSIKNLIGKSIKELSLNGDMNIPCLIRDDEAIMAHSSTLIQEKDHLLIFYKDKSVFDSFYNKYK
jgi:trk system potassium uptake protein TrkA